MNLTIFTALFNPVVSSSWREGMELEKIYPSSIIIQVLESWREGMELEKIHLLGHSFGGYLTAHYK